MLLFLIGLLIGAGLGVGGKYLTEYLIRLELERNRVNLDMGEILRWRNEIEKNKNWSQELKKNKII
jgi:hypothetical protein